MKVLVASADLTETGVVPRNLGDSYLTDSLLEALTAMGHSARAIDTGTSCLRATRVAAVSLRSLYRAIRWADGVLIGGGTLIQDDQPDRRFAGLPKYIAAVAVLCRAAHRPYAFVGVGAQDVMRLRARYAFRFAVRGARCVEVRDVDSRRTVSEQYGITPTLGCDAALLSPSKVALQYAADGNAAAPNRLVVALNQHLVSNASAVTISQLASQAASVELISMDQSTHWDFRDIDSGILTMSNVHVHPPTLTTADLVNLIGSAKAVISSRLHALYISTLLGRPQVAISGTPKVASYAKEFEIPLVSQAEIGTAISLARRAESAAVEAATARGRSGLEAALLSLGTAR
jgi:polysaccharide pyruvyl transferase WcaK-like protein